MARAHASSVINAPIEQGLGPYPRFQCPGRLASGHPLERDRGRRGVGSGRLHPQDGAGGRRRDPRALLEMSDLGHHYSYSILDSPLPVANYRATLRLRRISDGERTFAEWSATFDADPPEKLEEAEAMISNGVFQGGFDALKKHFGG